MMDFIRNVLCLALPSFSGYDTMGVSYIVCRCVVLEMQLRRYLEETRPAIKHASNDLVVAYNIIVFWSAAVQPYYSSCL